jgi:hypothetical protein
MQAMMNRDAPPTCEALTHAIMPAGPSAAAAASEQHGHVMLVDGVVTISGRGRFLIARNSFGLSWGVQGRCLIHTADLNARTIHSWVAVAAAEDTHSSHAL